MKFNLNLKIKIFASVMLVVLIAFLSLYLIIVNRELKIVNDDAFALAEETAEKYKNEIVAELQMAHATAETLSYTFQSLNNNGYTNRKMMNVILQENLEKKPYITAFCVAYEPNALDGMDRSYADNEMYAPTGRYAPYWNRLGENIEVEPLGEIDGADWYEIPKATKREFIMEPYKYHLQKQEVMLMSFFFPILINDEFAGIIASDISLNSIQEIVTRPNSHIAGGFSVIYAGTGIVAAHPNTDLLSKDVLDALPSGYGSNREAVANEVRLAIQDGRSYITKSSDFLTVFLPVTFSEYSKPWSVAVSLPINEIQRKATESRNYMLTVSLVSVFVIGVLIFLLSGTITGPLIALSASANAISNGNFEQSLPERKGNDEIAVLTRSFAAMYTQLKSLIQKLQDYTMELETKNANLNTLNDELIAANEQAERSSHAKSEFLSNMSHEMRTPLNAIIGMTAIGERADDIEKKDYSLSKIADASIHMLGVINDILDMSKIEANKLELSFVDFSLDKMLDRVVNFINFKVEECHQKFNVNIDPNIPNRLIGDDQRLAQTLTNLLSNAVKFTPENGSITLAVKFLTESADNMCTIQFAVSDTGIGISREQQVRLFQSFQQADNTTSRKFGGTGLGLAISKRIIELMGGQIWIESELGVGSTFFAEVMLQRSAAVKNSTHETNSSENNSEDEEEQNEKHKEEENIDFSGHCVLLADDVAINREIVIELLAPTNLIIECAENGKEALQSFADNPARYDLILMDVQMPEMDGMTATREIRKLPIDYAKTIPIIAMTANVFKEDVDMCRIAGMNDHLGKPLALNELHEKLKKYLNKV